MHYTILTHGTASFYDQGLGLARGLTELGIPCRVAGRFIRLATQRAVSRRSVCIGIGSWRSLSVIYDQPRSMGATVVPWLVSDDTVSAEAACRLNELEWFYVTSEWCQRTFEEAGVEPHKMRVLYEGLDTHFWSPSGTTLLDDWRQWIVPLWRSRHVNRLRLEALSRRPGAGVASDGHNLFATARLLANPSQVRLLTIGQDATSKGFQEVLRGLADTDHANVIHVAKILNTPCSRLHVPREVELAAEIGLTARIVYIVGRYRRTFIRDLIRWSTIYAAPSRHEGFGLPHVQAMSCAKPVVTCRGTAAEETSIDGVTGFVVPSTSFTWRNSSDCLVHGVRADPLAVRDALSTLIHDPSLRQRMGDEGRHRALEHFACREIAARVVSDTADLPD
jgi:alpha-maltose-1-phosphate synthase